MAKKKSELEKGRLSELEYQAFQDLDETQEIEPEDNMSEEGGTLMWVFVLMILIYVCVFTVWSLIHAS